MLACLDGYMNIAMEQTEEYDNGQLKAKYGDCFIRGNNGALSISVVCVDSPCLGSLTTVTSRRARMYHTDVVHNTIFPLFMCRSAVRSLKLRCGTDNLYAV